ncbi:cell wall metabolism sensor histidine kinase WalK [Pseudoruegeria sp. HB172150]|uniref:sensor histidine kinase n=1 Tax=Pseudoruegeria sp. HB172150 TaxID=2721164 RepID=UPI001556967C|nr:ATP-binding protein [Pseudoruegeria sp. HB172150]
MRAPGLVGRVLLLFGLGLFALWLLVAAALYRSGLRTDEAALTPQRLNAIVLAVEASGEGESAVMVGLSAPGLRLQLGPERLEPEMDSLPDEVLAQYSTVLAPRAVSAHWNPALRIGRLIKRPYDEELPHRALFVVQLTDGRYLSVTRAALPGLTRAGLPFGLVAGFLSSLIALLLLLFLLREARPLAALARAADRMEPGRIVELPRPRRASPELHALIGAFERLQARLHSALEARTTVISGVSHDVRTFATRLRLRVQHLPDPQERARAEAEIADMIRLLDDALLLGRAESGVIEEQLVRPGQVALAEAEARLGEGADVSVSGNMASAILGDPLAMRRLLANGVENALKYAGQARISVESMGDTVRVAIEDDGPGIPPELRDRLLEPFTRGEPSRNRATGGAGLGLAIMRSLAEAQGGQLAIESSASGGARIVATFPALDLSVGNGGEDEPSGLVRSRVS